MSVLTILLLAGCQAEVRFPPDLWQWDTGAWDTAMPDTSVSQQSSGAARIDASTLSWGCNPTNQAWTARFRTTGWSGGALLDLFGTEAWSEEHPMLLVDADADGSWDEYLAGPLYDGVEQSAWVAGSNSTFDCETDKTALTVVIRLQDRFGQTVDCVMWGRDPSAAQSVVQTPQISAIGGCRWLASM